MLTEEEELQGELKWISMGDQSFTSRLKSKGIFGVLVPLGCMTTLGILTIGIFNMYKQNSQRQQILMRYRVLAQGVTLGISMIGVYYVPK